MAYWCHWCWLFSPSRTTVPIVGEQTPSGRTTWCEPIHTKPPSMLQQKAKNETQKQPFLLGKIMLQIHFWGLWKVFRLIHLEHCLAHHSAMAPKIYKKDGRPSACTFLTPQKAANDSLQQDIPLKWSIKSSPWPMFFSCAPLERSSVNKRYLLTWAFASDSPTKLLWF